MSSLNSLAVAVEVASRKRDDARQALQDMLAAQQAAGVQNGVVGDHAHRVEAARRALLEAELRLASLRKVMEKRRHDLELAEMRRDQKQTDERAALQYRSAIQGSEGREY